MYPNKLVLVYSTSLLWVNILSTGLVDSVDNLPWTSIDHGQLAMCCDQCPCNMAIVHVTWTMSMKSRKFFCPWTIDVHAHEIEKTP